VRFAPVSIVSEAADGMWVSGLPKSVRIITVGQDFVTIGQEVNVAEQKVSGL
jgi:multidrug efflux system membrane fusion protein